MEYTDINTKETECAAMKNLLKRIKTNALVSAAAYTVFGLVLLIWPELSTSVLCTALGAVLVLCGLVDILEFLLHRDGSLYSAVHLIIGIILTAVGVWLVARPTLIAVIIPRIIGVIILFHGCKDLSDALTLHKNQSSHWLAAALLGIVTALLGAILVYNPFQAFATVVRVIGFFLIYDGISDIWITAQVSRAIKQAAKDSQTVVDVDYRDVDTDEET